MAGTLEGQPIAAGVEEGAFETGDDCELSERWSRWGIAGVERQSDGPEGIGVAGFAVGNRGCRNGLRAALSETCLRGPREGGTPGWDGVFSGSRFSLPL